MIPSPPLAVSRWNDPTVAGVALHRGAASRAHGRGLLSLGVGRSMSQAPRRFANRGVVNGGIDVEQA